MEFKDSIGKESVYEICGVGACEREDKSRVLLWV